MNWMSTWGIIGDPFKFVGKTIEAVEILQMESIAATGTCLLFKFTDGERGWLIGRRSVDLAVDPDEASLSESMIITPEEYGQYQAEKLARKQNRERESRKEKERMLERLKKELGQ